MPIMPVVYYQPKCDVCGQVFGACSSLELAVRHVGDAGGLAVKVKNGIARDFYVLCQKHYHQFVAEHRGEEVVHELSHDEPPPSAIRQLKSFVSRKANEGGSKSA